MIKMLILAMILLLTGCSGNTPAEMINYSDTQGNFIISAPSDFDYYDDASYSGGIFLIGTENGEESVMVINLPKNDSEYYTVEGLAASYEEGLFAGEGGFENKSNEVFYEDYEIEGSVDLLIKSFNAEIENSKFLIYSGYMEFEEEYYIVQVTSANGGRRDDYYLDTLASFERKRVNESMAVVQEYEENDFDFDYSDNWLFVEGEEHDYLVSVDGKATFLPFSMEEELDVNNINEYMEIAKDIIYEIYGQENTVLTHEEFKEVNGLDAGVIVYEYEQDGEAVVTRQFCAIQNNIVYVLTYTSDKESYEFFLNEIEYMENSFRVY